MRELRKYPKWRPIALESIARDFAFATPHRRIAISFVAGTLKPLRQPPQILTRNYGWLNTVRWRAVFKPRPLREAARPPLAAICEGQVDMRCRQMCGPGDRTLWLDSRG
jgi:hypothetical protein